jgi:hypothetical protein
MKCSRSRSGVGFIDQLGDFVSRISKFGLYSQTSFTRCLPILNFAQLLKEQTPAEMVISSLNQQEETDDAKGAKRSPDAVSLFLWLISPLNREIPEQCFRLSGRRRSSGF